MLLKTPEIFRLAAKLIIALIAAATTS